MKTILVTGGAGYIGSHTLIELINNNFKVVAIDDLANSSRESLRRVEQIAGYEIPFIEADVRDQSVLDDIFTTYDIDSVIHFAGLKAVGESVAKPLEYYDNNLVSTLALLEAMRKHSVKQLVFSSSATVYGNPSELPLRETSTVGIGLTNPYGKTKYMIEQIIQDYCAADPTFEATILRYFNPIGAHQSGQIGEDPNGIPNNLLPYVAQVAVGKLQSVGVFGNDYDTPDGTGIRDYIHVVDLARGHVAALQHMKAGASIYNLGTGSGTSVLEIIKAFSKACGRDLPYEIKPRRAGDIAACYADCSKAERELGWRAELSIEQACADSWRWQSQNPNGFSE
ncbi:MAG: UDP-glucose 4-epimerase GalE [Candidatus Nanosynbacter sp.]|nr:UDP-glucose 4-epimerase GalE [Candidatus Nanosynbacter sp.]